MTNKKFRQWLQSTDSQITDSETGGSCTFLKVPYSELLDFIFIQNTELPEQVDLTHPFLGIGVYRKDMGAYYSYRMDDLYPSANRDGSPLPTMDEIQKTFRDEICSEVERRAKLTIHCDTDNRNEETKQSIDYQEIEKEAAALYMSEDDSETEQRHDFIKEPFISRKDLYAYLTDPAKILQEKINWVMQTFDNQICLFMKKREAIHAAYQRIYNDIHHPLHLRREIAESLRKTSAVVVEITICKDGKTLKIPIASYDLRKKEPRETYQLFQIAASSRRLFFAVYGENAQLTPADIQQITTWGRPIYHAPLPQGAEELIPFSEVEQEDEDSGLIMNM